MEWLHGDKLLNETERIKFVADGDFRRLEINTVDMNEAGDYTVRVKNEETHSTGQLTVNGRISQISFVMYSACIVK